MSSGGALVMDDPGNLADLLTVGDIARRLGVKSNTVSSWRCRDMNDPFPRPAHTFGKSLEVFSWHEVHAWAIRTGRAPKETGHLYDAEGFDVTDQYRKKQ